MPFFARVWFVIILSCADSPLCAGRSASELLVLSWKMDGWSIFLGEFTFYPII